MRSWIDCPPCRDLARAAIVLVGLAAAGTATAGLRAQEGGGGTPQDEPRDTPEPAAQEPAEPDPATLAPPKDAAELFAWLRKVEGLEARFAEEKRMQLLAVPLRSSGRIWFLRGGYLARHVEKPEPSRVRITPKALTTVDADGEETIDLRGSPELRLFVTSLVKVFSGDAEGLGSAFRVEFAPDAERERGWTLALTPKERPLTEMLRRLAVVGTGRAIQRIVVEAPNGDRTVTRILDADPRRTFTPAQKLELFGIAPERAPAESGTGR